jgi:EpsD family peptidyl-prolyl cis-trans isomerase
MSRLGNLTEEQGKKASRDVLAKLVDQKLMVQKAEDGKLHRDPKVLQAIETAKSDILAQAYLEQKMAGAKKPSEQEIQSFYREHPELFEKRRVYRLQELSVPEAAGKEAEIEAGIQSLKSIAEIADWLKQREYKFSVNASVRAAEQLPLEMLPRLQQMKDGEVLVAGNQGFVNIIVLAGSQEQSVDLKMATPLIEQYYLNQRKGEIAKMELESLRKEAKIVYMGPFADMQSAKDQKPAAEAAKPETASQPATPAQADQIEKGVAGLK